MVEWSILSVTYTDKLIADMPVCFVYIYVHVNYLSITKSEVWWYDDGDIFRLKCSHL